MEPSKKKKKIGNIFITLLCRASDNIGFIANIISHKRAFQEPPTQHSTSLCEAKCWLQWQNLQDNEQRQPGSLKTF